MRTPCIHIAIVIAFLANTLGPLPLAQAQEFRLPEPGVMVHLSPPLEPPILKGIKVHPDNPFRFDFILDQGDSSVIHEQSTAKAGQATVRSGQAGSQNQEQLKTEAIRLIKYFLASLTIPEKDLWVNLSPYEKDRIIPQSFGLTEMGRDLLAEDYMLKQITASLIYPGDEVGKKFWKRVYEEAAKKYGTTIIPVNTFNKVWIVPEKAVVYENAKAGTAYVVESKLKVMLEQDYLALSKNTPHSDPPREVEGNSTFSSPPLVGGVRGGGINALGSQIVREIVIPELTKEVNEGKNFAPLRQVYDSLILATWYKKKVKDSILSQVYANKNKVAGVNIDDPQEKDKIYQKYLQAFKKGVYNYIKEEPDPVTQELIPRKYFSGGFDLAMTIPRFDASPVFTVINTDDAIVGNLPGAERITVDIASPNSNNSLDYALLNTLDQRAQAGDSAMKVDSGISSIIVSYLKGHDPNNLKEFLDEYLQAGSFTALNEKRENLKFPVRTISSIVQRGLKELRISEDDFRNFINANRQQVIRLRERSLVLERIKLSSHRNTTDPLLLKSVNKISQWLDVPLSNVRLEEFESELEKIGFWAMSANRQIKDGLAKEFLWYLDKVSTENIGNKEQWEAVILRTAWELELIGDDKSNVQQMFRRELKTRGYKVESIESILKEIPLPQTQPQGEVKPLVFRTAQEIRKWDVYNATGRNWYWDFWPPGRRQIIKDRLEILLKEQYVQFVRDLVAHLFPTSQVKAIIVCGSYLYGYEELKGTDIDTTVILSNGSNVPMFSHQSFTKDDLDKLNLGTKFSFPDDYWRKVTDFDFVFRTENGVREEDKAYIWGSGITIDGKDYSDRKPDQRVILGKSLDLLETGIERMWDYPLAANSDVDYMFGKIVKRLTEASLVLNQLFPDEVSQFNDLDYYPQLISYYKSSTEQSGRKSVNVNVERDFLQGVANTYLQRLNFIKAKVDAITDPDERWNDYIAISRVIRGIDRVSNFGDNVTLPKFYHDVHGLIKQITDSGLREAVQDKSGATGGNAQSVEKQSNDQAMTTAEKNEGRQRLLGQEIKRMLEFHLNQKMPVTFNTMIAFSNYLNGTVGTRTFAKIRPDGKKALAALLTGEGAVLEYFPGSSSLVRLRRNLGDIDRPKIIEAPEYNNIWNTLQPTNDSLLRVLNGIAATQYDSRVRPAINLTQIQQDRKRKTITVIINNINKLFENEGMEYSLNPTAPRSETRMPTPPATKLPAKPKQLALFGIEKRDQAMKAVSLSAAWEYYWNKYGRFEYDRLNVQEPEEELFVKTGNQQERLAAYMRGLVANALDAQEKGPIDVRLAHKDGKVIFSVTNQGSIDWETLRTRAEDFAKKGMIIRNADGLLVISSAVPRSNIVPVEQIAAMPKEELLFIRELMKGVKVEKYGGLGYDLNYIYGRLKKSGGEIKVLSDTEKTTFSLVFDVADKAMNTVQQKNPNNTGGIDLTPANMNLQSQNAGAGIKFRLDPAMLEQLKNAPGFVPVIINIQPMTNLRTFLGLADNQSLVDPAPS